MKTPHVIRILPLFTAAVRAVTRTWGASLSMLWLFSIGSGTMAHGQARKPTNPQLARLIDSLDRNDQLPFQQSLRGDLPPDSVVVRSQRTYRQNYPQLQRILHTYGYPGFALVGAEATGHFNNMVLHCFFDVPFQQQVLSFYKKEQKHTPALRSDKRYLRDLAYLTDKVRVNSGQQQLYGTQIDYDPTKGCFLKPTEHLATLDKRRHRMQLEPVQAYLQRATEMHRRMNSKR